MELSRIGFEVEVAARRVLEAGSLVAFRRSAPGLAAVVVR